MMAYDKPQNSDEAYFTTLDFRAKFTYIAEHLLPLIAEAESAVIPVKEALSARMQAGDSDNIKGFAKYFMSGFEATLSRLREILHRHLSDTHAYYNEMLVLLFDVRPPMNSILGSCDLLNEYFAEDNALPLNGLLLLMEINEKFRHMYRLLSLAAQSSNPPPSIATGE